VLVPKDSVSAEIDRNPRFARPLLAGMAARIERLVHELDAQAQGGAQLRRAAYLLRRAGAIGAGGHGSATLTLPASKAAIASQLGMTPEHLSRLLRAMTQQGLLQVKGRRIALPDLARLAQVAAAGRRPQRDPARAAR
jgi:CRP-like cAMP-binding protein